MEQTVLSRQRIISELFRTPKGQLGEYLPIGREAASLDADFLAHAIAYDHRNGSVRDAQVGLPVVTLATPTFPRELLENSLAHLALLNPKDLLRAWDFAHGRPAHAQDWLLSWRRHDQLKYLVHGYLRTRESCWPWWERTALWFRQPLKSLYALSRTKPSPEAQAILFGTGTGFPQREGLFNRLYQSRQWESDEVAGFIRQEKIPFLVSQGAYGARIKEPAILAAVVDTLSAGELSRHAALLEKWGWKETGATRGAKHEALARARQGAKRSGLFAATKAQAVVADNDPLLALELEHIQESQLDKQAGIEGNWLVGIDISGSMSHAMQPGLLLAAYLGRQVRGKVMLCLFNHEPYLKDVTGKTYAQLAEMMRTVVAQGGTSIGCVVAAARERGFEADAIAIVSDGGERGFPTFTSAYQLYAEVLGKEPPVYLYRVPGQGPDWLTERCAQAQIPYQCFAVPGEMNEAGLVSLAATMHTERYGFIQKILDTPLMTVEQAFVPPKQWRHSYASTT